MLRRIVPALIALAVTSLAACGPGSVDTADAQPGGKTELHASRAKDFKSISDLRAESTAIIRAVAEDSVVDTLNGLPITITTVRVTKILWGKVPTEKIFIQQVGDSSMILHDTGPLLEKDREYLLFVTPFHLTPNDDTGRYVITGNQGNFVLESGTTNFRFAGAGDPPLLPRTLRPQDISSEAR